MTELLFIRHGETDWNLQQRFQGQIDVPLNAHGRQQAQRLARRLAADRHDALFSSDLQRAQQTAAPLAAAWGLPVITLAGLREQHFGVLEGLDVPTIQARHPDLWQRWLQQHGDDALPGGGESLQQFHDRVLAAVRALLARQAGARIAIVTHGGVLDMLWRSAQCLPLHGLRHCAIPNTGLNRLRWRDDALVVEHWGDASHLEGPDDGDATDDQAALAGQLQRADAGAELPAAAAVLLRPVTTAAIPVTLVNPRVPPT